jgi:hypothetical protein
MARLAEVGVGVYLTAAVWADTGMQEGTAECTVVGIGFVHRATFRTDHAAVGCPCLHLHHLGILTLALPRQFLLPEQFWIHYLFVSHFTFLFFFFYLFVRFAAVNAAVLARICGGCGRGRPGSQLLCCKVTDFFAFLQINRRKFILPG